MGSREEQKSTLDAPRMLSMQKKIVHRKPTSVIDLTTSDDEQETNENQKQDEGIHLPPNPSVQLSWGHVFKHQARQTLTSLRQPGQRTLVEANHFPNRPCPSAKKQKLSLATILPGRAPPIEVRSSDGQQGRKIVKALGEHGKGTSEDQQVTTRPVLHQPVIPEDNLDHDPQEEQEEVVIDGCDYPLPDDQQSNLNPSLTDDQGLKSIAEQLLDLLASEKQHSVDDVVTGTMETGTALLEVNASTFTREDPYIVSGVEFEIENVAAYEEVMTYEAQEPDHEMESSNGMKDINVLLALYAEADVPVTDSSVLTNCCPRCDYSFPLPNGQTATVDKTDAATSTEPLVQKKMVDAGTQTDIQRVLESTGTNTDDNDSSPSLGLDCNEGTEEAKGRREDDASEDAAKKTLKDAVTPNDGDGSTRVPETPTTDLVVDAPKSSVSSKSEKQQEEMSSCRVLRKRKAVDDTLPVQQGRKNRTRTFVEGKENEGEPAAKRGRSANKTAELASTSTAQMKPASEIQMLFDGAVQEEPIPTVKAPKKGGNGRKRRRRGRRVTAPKSSTPIAIVGYQAVDPEEKPLIPIPLKRNSRYDKPQPPPCQFVQLNRPMGDYVPWFMQVDREPNVFP